MHMHLDLYFTGVISEQIMRIIITIHDSYVVHLRTGHVNSRVYKLIENFASIKWYIRCALFERKVSLQKARFLVISINCEQLLPLLVIVNAHGNFGLIALIINFLLVRYIPLEFYCDIGLKPFALSHCELGAVEEILVTFLQFVCAS